MRGIGKTNAEISEIIGFNVQYITDLVTKYMERGIESILVDRRTSNNRRMTLTEETSFLEQFEELAAAGQIVTVGKILEKFNSETGKNNDSSTIYRLLKRHGWRKVKPRPQHPGKASDEEIVSSKKLKQKSKSCWKKRSKRLFRQKKYMTRWSRSMPRQWISVRWICLQNGSQKRFYNGIRKYNTP